MPKENFYKDSSRVGSLSSECLLCHRARIKQYKLDFAKQVPNWANTKDIKEFYLACPAGMEVDHIIPINGVLVSGLHVLNNLQYLSKQDNLYKSNKFIV